tara:strand:+ start:551 stop:907 length:357 start_codon:yes stop_codon:yes gene_type:complete
MVIWLGIITLLLFAVGRLYIKDATSVEQAIIVEEYIKDYCRNYNHYPKTEYLVNQFPDLFQNNDWYYWPNQTWTVATFQYPMTLPLPTAIGHSKISEFFPIIYSYAVKHPCKDLIPED